MNDTNTTVLDRFVECCNFDWLWVGIIVMSLVAAVLIAVACCLYIQAKEAQRILDERDKE